MQPSPTPFLPRAGHLASRSVLDPPPASPLPWVPGVRASQPALVEPEGHPAGWPSLPLSEVTQGLCFPPCSAPIPSCPWPFQTSVLVFPSVSRRTPLLQPHQALPTASHPRPPPSPESNMFHPPPPRPGLKNSSSWKVAAGKEVTSAIWPQGWALLSPAQLKACPAHLQSANGAM